MTKPLPTSEDTHYQAGDVVVVPFPYADRLAEKRRPALIVSNKTLNDSGVLWIVMITSKLHEPRDGDTLLGDHERAGLKAASVIRSSKIACIETRRVLRKIGSIAKADLASVADEICRFVDVGGAKSRRSKK